MFRSTAYLETTVMAQNLVNPFGWDLVGTCNAESGPNLSHW